MAPTGRTTEVVGGGGFGRVLRSAAVGMSVAGCAWPGAFDGGAGAFTPGLAPGVRGFPAGVLPDGVFPAGVFPAGVFPERGVRPAGMLITGIRPADGSGFGACSGFDPD